MEQGGQDLWKKGDRISGRGGTGAMEEVGQELWKRWDRSYISEKRKRTGGPTDRYGVL